ncbi:single-stranded DNA-binding protein [Mucilaginibacter sp. PAMB04168]|uniref:single-stranded DNA-binding protein n=1 Tax=Mucilaginibacter sp. PAMB04168 TaxID=3138567 RepID=UPI0031F6C778
MQFTGRLTADAEVRQVKHDKKVTAFTVAVNKRYKTREGEKREKTSFIRCAYWVNPGLAIDLTKGAIVEVNGLIEAEAWTDKTGRIQASLTCSVDTVKLYSGTAAKTTASAQPEEEKSMPAASGGTPPEDDDLPF